jgi:UDP-N-acetylmuramoyl-L-alanyl-D-glutamate--2,6-diaminopimelate ligase
MLALMVEDKVDYLFMEATSHALALNKLDPLHFEAAIYTNLTPEHLDFHGSMENYFDAKASLFGKTSLALINVDCPYGSRMAAVAREAGCRVLTCSAQGNAADFRGEDVRADGVDGIRYTLESESAYYQVKCPIPGSFTVKNSLQAAALSTLFGILPSTVQDALQKMHHVDGRIERVKLCPGAEFSVFIDYAHTPDALENLLNAARGFRMPGQRVVLLFGCGGDRDKTKRPKMAEIACKRADSVIITSDNSRSEEPTEIIRDILAGVDPSSDYVVIPDRAEAIEYAIEYAKKGDIILLAGKGHETYEINRTGRHAFCEREIAEAAAEKFYGLGH